MKNIPIREIGQRTILRHTYWSLSKGAGAVTWIKRSGRSIKGRRSSYLDKKIRTEKDSFLMGEIAEIEERITFEEMREIQEREQILLKESAGERTGADLSSRI